MHDDSIVFSIFLIFTGAAVLATLALYARQAMLVAYIVLGILLGPWGFGLVDDAKLIEDIAKIGIVFLLFLLGLNLYPQKLIKLFAETSLVTIASSLLFALTGYIIALGFGFSTFDCIVIALAMVFSSTIIGLKLLPTTVLHHRHTGEIIISILLMQDLIAIVAFLVIQGYGGGEIPVLDVAVLLLKLPLFIGGVLLFERYIILKLLQRFDRIHEYIFLLTIGWCLGVAAVAKAIGLSYEIGAFIAGVAVATNPIAKHIAETLKPLRDFFLVMFFFAVGAGFNIMTVADVLLPALMLAATAIVMKPVVFRFLLVKSSETSSLGWETGFRLGQMSEFSLLLVFVALDTGLLSEKGANLVRLATMLTFIISTYLIVLRFPTPIAISDRLRRD